LGYVYYHLAQYEQALAQHKRAYQFHQIGGDSNRMAWDLADMGIMCLMLYQLETAEKHLRASLRLAREIGSRPAESYALNNLGRWYALHGDYTEALRCHETSLRLQRATGSKRGEAAALIFAAQAQLGLQNHEKAAQLLQSAQDICRAIDHQLGLVEALATTAVIRLQSISQALATARAALNLARTIEAPYYETWALSLLAELHRRRNEDARANEFSQAAALRARDIGLDEAALRKQLWFMYTDGPR
jgi:tetratricopeptide (TPR) repeat protein